MTAGFRFHLDVVHLPASKHLALLELLHSVDVARRLLPHYSHLLEAGEEQRKEREQNEWPIRRGAHRRELRVPTRKGTAKRMDSETLTERPGSAEAGARQL